MPATAAGAAEGVVVEGAGVEAAAAEGVEGTAAALADEAGAPPLGPLTDERVELAPAAAEDDDEGSPAVTAAGAAAAGAGAPAWPGVGSGAAVLVDR